MWGALSVLRGLFSHGQTEDFGQCGIEGGAGLLTDLLQGFVVAETCPFGSFGGQVVITHPLPPLCRGGIVAMNTLMY